MIILYFSEWVRHHPHIEQEDQLKNQCLNPNSSEVPTGISKSWDSFIGITLVPDLHHKRGQRFQPYFPKSGKSKKWRSNRPGECLNVLFGKGVATFEVKARILADKSLGDARIEAINHVLTEGYSGLKLLSVGPEWMTVECEWDDMNFEFRAWPSQKTVLNIE